MMRDRAQVPAVPDPERPAALHRDTPVLSLRENGRLAPATSQPLQPSAIGHR